MTYPWTSGDVLTASDLNAYAGLVHVATYSGTGVASATFNNVFPTDFTAFRVVIRLPAMGGNLKLNWRVGGTTATAADYVWVMHGLSSNGTALNSSSGTSDIGHFVTYTNITSSIQRQGVVFDVINPNTTETTVYMGNGQSYNSGGNYWTFNVGGWHNVATAYDGFVLAVSSGTMDHQTSIYGYNNG